MKKKVLTVMAVLALMGGKAFAYDYQWTMSNLSGSYSATRNVLAYDNTNTTQAVLTFVGKDGAKKSDGGMRAIVDGTETNNYLTFDVKQGDKIVVTAKNLNGDGSRQLSVRPASGVAVSANVQSGATHTLTLDPSAAAGTVKVYAQTDIVITDITVESEAYRKVSAAVESAQQKLNDTQKGIANYVSNTPDFYNAVMAELNQQGVKIEELLANLEERKVENTVEGQEDATVTGTLAELLAACEAAITADETAAATAYSTYQGLIATNNTDYQAANDRITLAYKENPRQADYNADKNAYLYDFTYESTTSDKITKKTEKADGIKAYMDKYAKEYLASIKNDSTKKYLAEFPYASYGGSFPTTKVTNLYADAKQRVDNIIDRYVYERDKQADFDALKKGIETMESLQSSDFVLPTGFNGLKTNVNNLYTDLTKSDNKHVYTESQLATRFTNPLGNYQTTLQGYQNTWAATANAKQTARATEVQANLDEVSYKISAQFEKEPETQKTWQAKFAELQVRVNNIVKANATVSFTLVENHEANMKELNDVNDLIQQYWGETQDDQNSEIVTNNNAALATLIAEIERVKKIYTDGVNKINGYKDIPGIGDNSAAVNEINKSLTDLFNHALPLDECADKARKEVDDLNANFERFDATDLTNTVTSTETSINTDLVNARAKANEAAYQFLTGLNYDGTTASRYYQEGTVPYTERRIQNVRSSVSSSTIASTAGVALDAIADGVKNSGSIEYDGNGYAKNKGYVFNAMKHINDWANNEAGEDPTDATKNFIADKVAEVKTLLAPALTEADEVLAQVDAYDEFEKEINNFKIRWTVAKANTTDSELVALLETVNDQIVKVNTTLTTDKLGALSKQESYYDVQFEKIDKDLWHAEDPTAYAANEAAYKKATDKLTEVKAELTAALETVGDLTLEDVKKEYTSQLNAVSFTSVESKIEDSYENRTADSDYRSIEIDLERISSNIASIVKEAQDADEAGQKVPGDMNDDGVVDGRDASVISAGLGTTTNIGDFSTFIVNFKKYNDKQ